MVKSLLVVTAFSMNGYTRRGGDRVSSSRRLKSMRGEGVINLKVLRKKILIVEWSETTDMKTMFTIRTKVEIPITAIDFAYFDESTKEVVVTFKKGSVKSLDGDQPWDEEKCQRSKCNWLTGNKGPVALAAAAEGAIKFTCALHNTATKIKKDLRLILEPLQETSRTDQNTAETSPRKPASSGKQATSSKKSKKRSNSSIDLESNERMVLGKKARTIAEFRHSTMVAPVPIERTSETVITKTVSPQTQRRNQTTSLSSEQRLIRNSLVHTMANSNEPTVGQTMGHQPGLPNTGFGLPMYQPIGYPNMSFPILPPHLAHLGLPHLGLPMPLPYAPLLQYAPLPHMPLSHMDLLPLGPPMDSLPMGGVPLPQVPMGPPKALTTKQLATNSMLEGHRCFTNTKCQSCAVSICGTCSVVAGCGCGPFCNACFQYVETCDSCGHTQCEHCVMNNSLQDRCDCAPKVALPFTNATKKVDAPISLASDKKNMLLAAASYNFFADWEGI